MTKRLDGKTAVITGGSTGIGRAIALRFAEEGAAVVINDINELSLWEGDGDKSTAQLITENGGRAIYAHGDVSNSADVNRLFEQAVSEFGRIDVVLNNAAIFEAYSILETTEESWDKLMNINLRGQFLVAKRAIDTMIEQDIVKEARGRLINVSSQHGMVGPPEFLAYAVAKGGTVNMTRQLAVDYGKHGILVNGLAPGRILVRFNSDEEAAAVDSTIAYSKSRTPFHRLGRVSDLTGPAVFLASDDCTYVSGHNLLVDGGWMAF